MIELGLVVPSPTKMSRIGLGSELVWRNRCSLPPLLWERFRMEGRVYGGPDCSSGLIELGGTWSVLGTERGFVDLVAALLG